jgi:hypothetical protein
VYFLIISNQFQNLNLILGWVPGSLQRLGNPKDIPPVENPIKIYTNNVSFLLNVYIVTNFMFLAIAFSQFTKDFEVKMIFF